jgi:hypothetical protein
MVIGIAGGIFYLFCGILVVNADRETVRRPWWQYPFVSIFGGIFCIAGSLIAAGLEFNKKRKQYSNF